MSKYIIIDAEAIQKRIEELETGIKTLSLTDGFKDIGRIDALKEILSKSTPLIPEIRKAYWDAINRGEDISSETSNSLIQDYISNLKLNL